MGLTTTGRIVCKGGEKLDVMQVDVVTNGSQASIHKYCCVLNSNRCHPNRCLRWAVTYTVSYANI